MSLAFSTRQQDGLAKLLTHKHGFFGYAPKRLLNAPRLKDSSYELQRLTRNNCQLLQKSSILQDHLLTCYRVPVNQRSIWNFREHR